MADVDVEDDLSRHSRLHESVSDSPLVGGNRVTLLPDGAAAINAVMDAIERAEDHVHMEYYTVADVVLGGRSLFEVLRARARAGVEVALIWDAIGSGDTPDSHFDRLRAAGVRVLEYHSINPLRQRFNISVNDRDHRKLTVVDGTIGFLGGVNLAKNYETPESVGRGSDANHAYWIDNAVRVEGPVVAEIQKLFFHIWRTQGGDPAPMRGGPEHAPPPGAPMGPETLRVAGSAPWEKRPLYNEAIRAAVEGARRHVLLATGYFVPTTQEHRMLSAAARRGVEIDLLLAGYSDVSAAVHAARSIYGPLLKAGVRIHEVQRGMLHAKVATVDGVWTAIGSSNFDRRSVYYNNEIDAIVLGRDTAGPVEEMLRQEIARADHVSLPAWQSRPLRDRAIEISTRLWKRLM